MLLKMEVYKRGLKHGRAAECFEPPMDETELETYEAGYIKGFNEMMRTQRQEKLDYVD